MVAARLRRGGLEGVGLTPCIGEPYKGGALLPPT